MRQFLAYKENVMHQELFKAARLRDEKRERDKERDKK